MSVGKASTFKTKKCEFLIQFPLTKENVDFYKQNLHFQFNYKFSQFYMVSNSSNCYFQFQPILTYELSPLNFFVFPKEKISKISSDISNNEKFLNISSVKREPLSEIQPLLFKRVENINKTEYNTSIPTVDPFPNSFYSKSKNIVVPPFLIKIGIVAILLGAIISGWKKNRNKK